MMNETQIRIIRAIQGGLSLTEEPFDEIAEKAGVSVEELLAQLREWQADGTIRRFGAILKHHNAGYDANAMVAWNVPEDGVEAFAEVATSLRSVSHCYERPRFEGFGYNLYTMIHGKCKEDCEEAARGIAEETGVRDYRMLYTTAEFKKSSPVYFASGEHSALRNSDPVSAE